VANPEQESGQWKSGEFLENLRKKKKLAEAEGSGMSKERERSNSKWSGAWKRKKSAIVKPEGDT